MWFWPRTERIRRHDAAATGSKGYRQDAGTTGAGSGTSTLTREVAGVASELGGALGLWTGAAPQRDPLLGGGGFGSGGGSVHGPGVPAPDSAYQYPYGLFEEAVDKDAHLSALLGQRKAAVLAWERGLEPSSGSAEAVAACALVQAGLGKLGSAGFQPANECRQGMPQGGDGGTTGMDRDLWELLDALPYGIAISEVVWEWVSVGTGVSLSGVGTSVSSSATVADSLTAVPTADALTGQRSGCASPTGLPPGRYLLPKALLSRHPRRFVFSPEGELRLLTPAEPVYGEPVPARKFIVFAPYGRHENPYGSPLVARVWWLAWFKRQVLKYWVLHCEKYGMPAVVLTHPPAATERERASYRRLIGSIQQETGLVVPEGVGLSLLEASRSGGPAAYQALLEFCNSEMSKAIVGQTLTVDTPAGGTGSYAMARVHQQVREDLTRMDAQALMSCVNGTLVRWICELNATSRQPAADSWQPGLGEISSLQAASCPLPAWVLKPPPDHDLRLQLDIDRFFSEQGLATDAQEMYGRYGRSAPANT